MNDTLQHREVAPEQAEPPVLQHTDDLPSWLAPDAQPVPPGPLSNPVVTWSGTLLATALMVAFGLWLGDSQTPAPPATVASMPAPAAPAVAVAQPAAPVTDVPPMVMVAEPAVPAEVPPAPAARAIPAVQKTSVPRRRVAAPGGRTVARAKNRPQPITASTAWRKPIMAAASKAGPAIRCQHGELVRECLARYR
ncbi:hypothetical protein [Massilia sp. CF038]|uniref:hypothetical protein n=1 Tax=Massilia sp. CF038 TaxID=1881045 RepID=UPI000913AFD7|nr:hypothetical protein [Massilia sp. CF038]SHG77835.1 hypothetical protein SAMN05428948_1995 [Massilia sp. CF038]